MGEKSFVEIDLSRYEELVRYETRASVACELAESGANIETVLVVLGTPEARKAANKIIQEREEMLAKYREGNNGN